MSIQFNYQKHFYFKLFIYSDIQIQLIPFSITQLNVKTFLYKTIQFSISKVPVSTTVPFQTI